MSCRQKHKWEMSREIISSKNQSNIKSSGPRDGACPNPVWLNALTKSSARWGFPLNLFQHSTWNCGSVFMSQTSWHISPVLYSCWQTVTGQRWRSESRSHVILKDVQLLFGLRLWDVLYPLSFILVINKSRVMNPHNTSSISRLTLRWLLKLRKQNVFSEEEGKNELLTTNVGSITHLIIFWVIHVSHKLLKLLLHPSV